MAADGRRPQFLAARSPAWRARPGGAAIMGICMLTGHDEQGDDRGRLCEDIGLSIDNSVQKPSAPLGARGWSKPCCCPIRAHWQVARA